MWKRVIAPIVLVSLLWIAVSGATTHYVNRLTDSHQRILSENVSTIQAAAGMQDVLWRLQAAVLEAAGSDRPGPQIEIAELEAGFQGHLEVAERTAFTAEEQVLVRTIREQFHLFRERIRGWMRPKGSAGASKAPSAQETVALARAIAQPCKQLLEINDRLLSDSYQRSSRLANWLIVTRSLFLVAGPLVGIVFGVIVARGLQRSVSRISVTLSDATGELDEELGRVEVSRSGDLPELQQQVEAISAQIKQVVGQLHQARREVIRAERLAAVGELAAGVAHELRNPLTSVKLLVQTAAQRRPGRALSDKQLQVIRQEIGRMENTIQSLLDFARPPALNRVHHDVRDTLGRALNLTEGLAGQERVQIVCQWPEQPIVVHADREQIHQVFVNLLLNGIESMSGGGVLRVVLGADAGSDTCRIVFSDSGQGIPPPLVGRIFEPFVTSKEHGTGLGLAISRRITQEHGGTIRGINLEAGGAEFAVELPLSPPSLRPSQHGNDAAVGDDATPPVASSPRSAIHAQTPGH